MGKFIDNVQKMADNISSLEVATLTNQKGKIGENAPVTGEKLSDIFASIRKGMANAELVAYSKFNFEGDTINYINNTPEVANLVDEHKEMVLLAQTARKTFFDTVLRIVGK